MYLNNYQPFNHFQAVFHKCPRQNQIQLNQNHCSFHQYENLDQILYYINIIIAENSDNENNLSEPLNIENTDLDLLVDFIENSDDDSNYIENGNENNILFSFSKDQPLTSLSYDSFNFNELFGPNVLVDIKSPMQNFDIYFSDYYHYIVDQSNLYSNQCGKNLNLSITEFKAFLVFL